MDALEALLDAGRTIARRARERCDDAEVFLLRVDRWTFEVHDEEVRPELRAGRVQVGVRALKGGRLALSSTTSLDPDDSLHALDLALTTAKPTELERFSAARSPPRAAHDPTLAGLAADPAALHRLATEIGARFRAEPGHGRIEAFEAGCELAIRRRAVVTSAGEGGVVASSLSAWVDLESNHFRVHTTARADEAELGTIRGLGAAALAEYPEAVVGPDDLEVRGRRVRALLEPRLVEGTFRTVLQEKLLASSKAAGSTQLVPGTPLFGEGLTLDSVGDDPAIGGGPCDDEATPAGRVRVVEHGRFASFLSSRLSAKRTGVPETGNGVRTPLFDEEPSEALVRDRLVGLELAAGTRSRQELLASIDVGVVLGMLLGLHGCDRARATFSASARGGFAVRDGKVVGRLAPGRWNVAGRMLDGADGPSIFARAEASRERELTGSGRVPWVLGDVDVA